MIPLTSDLHSLRGTQESYASPVLMGMTLGSVAGESETLSPPSKSTTPLPIQAADFGTVLDQATQQLTQTGERRTQAEDAAAGLVSNALILPILKQIRRSPFGENTVFSGGTGEKTFGPQFDMQLADRIAHSPRLGIKNVLADRMMKKTPQKTVAASAKHAGLDING